MGDVTCHACHSSLPPGARFCPTCGVPQEGTETPAPSGVAGTDELRPATALFADVVGSTALGERLAPDEVKALIGECVSRMTHAVEEFGGTLQAYMGDGIAAYFGLPRAHEDDPERAAMAALRILEVVGEYGRDIRAAWGITDFDVRVGINTGQVGVGLVGGANPQEVGLGDATNVAARLQSSAEPGTVFVGEVTARMIAHGFVLEPVGTLPLKGRDEPVAAWRLVGLRDTTGARPETPLVGRDQEIGRLRGLLEELLAGRGQILEILGEVGIGKTRLLLEVEAVAGDRVTWLEGKCVSYGSQLTYAPFVEMLREWLGLAEGDAEVAVRTRLRARLGELCGPRLPEVLPYLGRLLSVRLEPGMEASLEDLPAEEMARRVRSAYRIWIEVLTRTRPVVVAVEDLHWADPSTRELAEELLALTDRAPLMLATTFRQDPASEGWKFRLRVLAEYAHRAVEMELGPLSDDEAERLADLLVPGAIEPQTIRAIVERAEGNPLYLEELLRGLIESGALERRRTWTLTAGEGLVPPALESLLVARLDRLPPEARSLAQVAAVVGRTFSVRVLEGVAGEGGLDERLAVLLRADLIRERRRYPESEYAFRHGLLHEAVLSTLPEPHRRGLHGRVAEVVEREFAGSVEDHLEVLAHHYAASRDLPKALEYLERAGERATTLDARPQAEELWRRARKVAAHLGDEAAARRIEDRLAAL